MVSKFNLLKALIFRKFSSMRDFEKACGLSKGYVEECFCKNNVCKEMIDKMSKGLGVDLSNLVIEANEKKHRYTQDIYAPTNMANFKEFDSE